MRALTGAVAMEGKGKNQKLMKKIIYRAWYHKYEGQEEQVKVGLIFLPKLLRRLVILPTKKLKPHEDEGFRDVELKVLFMYIGRGVQCLAHSPAYRRLGAECFIPPSHISLHEKGSPTM